MNYNNTLLRNICEQVVFYFRRLNNSNYNEIMSKLAWCIGSFDNDQNPIGLVEYGEKAYDNLSDLLKEHPDDEIISILTQLRTILDYYNDILLI